MKDKIYNSIGQVIDPMLPPYGIKPIKTISATF